MNRENETAREYLLQIPFWTKKKNTLQEVRDFLVKLGDPERKLKIIHVAGTNGKGSVCADLTAILRKAGYRTGTFVSPHLVDIRERFLIDGEMVSEECFEQCFRRVRSVVEEMIGRGYCHPTFFEYCFLMAMVMFEQEQTDYCILETGLGGRLDTTNVVRTPLASVITSISLDHTQYLGDTIPLIAAEKAGIIKAGVPVIYDGCQPEASAVICARAARLGADAWQVSDDRPCGQEILREVSFAAPYQRRNAMLALKVLEVLKIPGVDSDICRSGLQSVRWPGRMEEVLPGVWLDGAHNPGGIRAFVQAVREKEGDGPVQLLFAAVSDKDFTEMIHMLCGGLSIEQVTVAHIDSERGTDESVLADQFAAAGCPQVARCATVDEALRTALALRRPGRRLYVAGSLYLIGEIKEKLATL